MYIRKLELGRIKYMNRWIIFFLDLFLSVCSTGISLLFTSSVFSTAFPHRLVWPFLLLSGFCSVISIFCFQLYKGVIRHSTFIEAGRIGIASLFKIVLLISGIYILWGIEERRLLFVEVVVDVFFTFFSLIVVRVMLITIYNYLISNNHTSAYNENMLILDTDIQSTSGLSTSLGKIEQNYRITGFIKPGTGKRLRKGNYIVYPVRDQAAFDKLVNRYTIKAVLFPDYTEVKAESDRLVRYCEKRKVRMLVLPALDELKEGRISYRNLPEVRIEDLLERKEIKINMNKISHFLEDNTVLVTGAAGSIGSELCRQLCHYGLKKLILFDSAETPMYNLRLELEETYPEVVLHPVIGDVRNRERMKSVFERFQPRTVFHAAAYKHVPLMEENPCEAVHTNTYGTIVAADLAIAFGVEKFVMISTDKAVNPTNVMGASKRLAEIYVQSLGLAVSRKEREGQTRFITTRFGNVLGSNGSVIPRFREQLAKGGPLTVTHPDIIRYFMTIPEACQLVLEAACMGIGNDILIFDMGEPVKITALARRMIELAGLEPDKDIQIVYTGLRPGEKLYEELLAEKENTLPTFHDKIFRARVREYRYTDIVPRLLSLCETAQHGNITETVLGMKDLVPEFKSQHCHFECLDGEAI
ncbi:MAG: polysaccharide biosynthesis protein [Tannerellaceae bacterium]|jgi:FlaA1/EpsC-like NDP-sugar epimerase|nr:polysaccharide biosynthesis protein [Tannerellaceae bacterium]